jgi:hypothetical protein
MITIIILYILSPNILSNLVSHTLINKTSCKDNPLLNLINIPTLIDSLYDTASLEEYNYCSFAETCCSSDSYSILLDYIETEEISNKLKIFEANLQYYSLIISEHLRNFMNYNIDEDSFNKMFRRYSKLVDELYMITNDIVSASVKYEWDSFCEYICNPSAISKCKIYNDTYYDDDTYSYNFTYKCDIPISRFKDMKEDIINYTNIIRTINSTIDSIYDDILENSQTLAPTNMTLLINSLVDGRCVSKSYSKNFRYNDKTTFVRYISNLCSLYSCIDDMFMRIYEDDNEQLENLVEINYIENGVTIQHDKDGTIDALMQNYKFSFEISHYVPVVTILIYFLFILY